jgi:transcriptional regulator with XRE-family HTH domain
MAQQGSKESERVATTRRRTALAQRRKVVGHTQESFAELLGIDRSTIVRWESGATDPTPMFRPKMAKALSVTLDELDRILSQSSDPRPSEQSFLPSAGQGQNLPRPSATLKGSNGDVSMIFALRTADKKVGGAYLYRAVIDHLHVEVGPKLFGTISGDSGRQLFSSAAALAEMAGWMAHDAGHDTRARHHFQRSLDLATVGQDCQLTAHILGSMAHLANHEREPVKALTLARRGADVLTDTHPRLQARLLAMQARAHAALRQPQECILLLAKAEAALSRDPQEQPSPWISDFDEGSLANEWTRCMRQLGNHQEARRQADRVITLRPDEGSRSRAFGQIALAGAHLAQGQPEEACAIVRDVFDATQSLSSYLVVQQLLHLTLLLKPYRGIGPIGEFLDCLEAALPRRLLTCQLPDQSEPASATAPRESL